MKLCAFVCVFVLASCQASNVPLEKVASIPGEISVQTMDRSSAVSGRSIISSWGNRLRRFFGFDNDYYNDYDNDYAYSSYSSYDSPYNNFAPARDDDFDDEEPESLSWGETAMSVFAAVVPIGVLLAALPAGFLTIAVRRRSLDEGSFLEQLLDPALLQSLVETEFMGLTDRQCQQKLFCQISSIGQKEDASTMQKLIYYAAHLMPEPMARRVGVEHLLKASRDGTCDQYVCAASSIWPDQLGYEIIESNDVIADKNIKA